ncbi:hypothetical protein, partial [Endozoicomonas sp. ONNA2]|uniref:hypothetical protein n=1 Tax=Endozoicomonas sp. ONNA2 TaxID=2828741 RepID=UPI0021499568
RKKNAPHPKLIWHISQKKSGHSYLRSIQHFLQSHCWHYPGVFSATRRYRHTFGIPMNARQTDSESILLNTRSDFRFFPEQNCYSQE